MARPAKAPLGSPLRHQPACALSPWPWGMVAIGVMALRPRSASTCVWNGVMFLFSLKAGRQYDQIYVWLLVCCARNREWH